MQVAWHVHRDKKRVRTSLKYGHGISSFTRISNFSVEHRYIYNMPDNLAIACGSPDLRYSLNNNWKGGT